MIRLRIKMTIATIIYLIVNITLIVTKSFSSRINDLLLLLAIITLALVRFYCNKKETKEQNKNNSHCSEE